MNIDELFRYNPDKVRCFSYEWRDSRTFEYRMEVESPDGRTLSISRAIPQGAGLWRIKREITAMEAEMERAWNEAVNGYSAHQRLEIIAANTVTVRLEDVVSA